MKPIASVSLEGCIVTGCDPAVLELGQYRPGVKEKLAKLRETHYVIIVSRFFRTRQGVQIALTDFLRKDIPHDELWMSDSLPEAAVRYDDDAKAL